MRLFFESPIAYTIVTIIAGVLALLPAIVIGLDAGHGVDAFAGLMLLTTLPLAIGGILALVGGVMVLRRRSVGRILASIGLAIGVLHPLLMGVDSLATIGACGPLPRDCADRWFGVVVLLGGAAILGYLIAALWLVRRGRQHAAP